MQLSIAIIDRTELIINLLYLLIGWNSYIHYYIRDRDCLFSRFRNLRTCDCNATY